MDQIILVQGPTRELTTVTTGTSFHKHLALFAVCLAPPLMYCTSPDWFNGLCSQLGPVKAQLAACCTTWIAHWRLGNAASASYVQKLKGL